MITDTSTLAKQMSLARKCSKHGLDHKNWMEKVKDWIEISVGDTINFDHLFLLCENTFGDDWVWSRDSIFGTYVYFRSDEDAVIFKLKYENLSKQVS